MDNGTTLPPVMRSHHTSTVLIFVSTSAILHCIPELPVNNFTSYLLTDSKQKNVDNSKKALQEGEEEVEALIEDIENQEWTKSCQ